MIDLPDSVVSYLENDDIATAVDALLAPKQSIPSRLGWDEVPTYFQAVGAAQQVKVEYVLAVERFWQAVWGDAVRDLTPASVDEQRDEDALTSFEDIWEDQSIDRCFKLSDDQWLYTSAGFDRENSYLLAYIDQVKPKNLAAQLDDFDLNPSGEWARLQLGRVIDSKPLETLRDGAQRVVAIAKALRAD